MLELSLSQMELIRATEQRSAETVAVRRPGLREAEDPASAGLRLTFSRVQAFI